MTPVVAGIGSQFSDAIDFILHPRESISGGVQIGGLEEIGRLAFTHMWVSLVAVAIAAAIAVPTGLYLGHKGKGEFLAVSISNVGRAVPTLALIAFFIAYLGIGLTNVIAVLILLAIPPILTNAYVGTRQVEREAVDAARGMGMTDAQIIRKVEFPMALPTIFGGLRISAVNVVATATIAPLANVRTLGEPIINENIYGDAGQLGASILVALIALATNAGLSAAQRAITPRGLKVADAPSRRRWWRPQIPSLRRREQPT